MWLAAWSATGQIADHTHLVRLSDKTWGKDYPFSLDAPELFLSERAVARRTRQGIEVDSLDLPVSADVVKGLHALADWEVVHASKWMSSVTVVARDSTADLDALTALPFVADVKRLHPLRSHLRLDLHDKPHPASKDLLPSTAYGEGWTALGQLNASSLHALGFDGRGIWIAVMDAGFEGVLDLEAFESLRTSGRVVAPENANVAYGGNDVFGHHRHGASVLGTMGCMWEDSLIGTAPGATYFCYITEDVTQERLLEEEHWIVAAEHADSLGVDLINTSLGYSMFDDSTSNHAVEELDGHTARISVASGIAASKGMLVVTSAGNNGDDPWRAITFPADAHGILSVGAVRANGNHGWFSGFGPSQDGRVKPEVMALGVSTPYPRFDGRVGRGNGTSFASPILCGAAASLWQAHPSATAQQVRQAILESAHLYSMPNDSMGYGIPDMWKAHLWLTDQGQGSSGSNGANVVVFPNPASPHETLRWTLVGGAEGLAEGTESLVWTLTGPSGKTVAEGTLPVWPGDDLHGHLDLRSLNLSSGTYLLTLSSEDATWRESAPCMVVTPSP